MSECSGMRCYRLPQLSQQDNDPCQQVRIVSAFLRRSNIGSCCGLTSSNTYGKSCSRIQVERGSEQQACSMEALSFMQRTDIFNYTAPVSIEQFTVYCHRVVKTVFTTVSPHLHNRFVPSKMARIDNKMHCMGLYRPFRKRIFFPGETQPCVN